jgi:hypothetical protein
MTKVTRIEIIDRTTPIDNEGGRVYTNYNINDAWLDEQDDGATLKIFINETLDISKTIHHAVLNKQYVRVTVIKEKKSSFLRRPMVLIKYKEETVRHSGNKETYNMAKWIKKSDLI